jgi:hypothetical protein
MTEKVELISVTKNQAGAYVIAFLINSEFYRRYQVYGYNKRDAIKRARLMAKIEASN